MDLCGADVGAEIKALEALGCSPFIHVNMAAPGWTEQGEARKVKVEMAMGYTEDEQIELLGPGKIQTSTATRSPPMDL